MQHLWPTLEGDRLSPACRAMSNLGKVLRVVELNHTLRCLCGPPSIPLSFKLALVVPRRNTYRVSWGTRRTKIARPMPSIHRLRRGLPGYLIRFAPHAFAPERQQLASPLVSPWVFLPISTHFTTTPAIPWTSPMLESRRMGWRLAVKPPGFTPHARDRLRALYAQSIRTTLGSSVLPRLLAQS
jgi:hypothetical protein